MKQNYYKANYKTQEKELDNMINNAVDNVSHETEKSKKAKECGFINVTDPNLRKSIIEISRCPADATNFTFWFQKSDESHWGLTIKSMPRTPQDEYERNKGMIFHSQHTWKITWYNDGNVLKVANHSRSLAEDITGNDYKTIVNIYDLYKVNK